eukprot:35539_1
MTDQARNTFSLGAPLSIMSTFTGTFPAQSNTETGFSQLRESSEDPEVEFIRRKNAVRQTSLPELRNLPHRTIYRANSVSGGSSTLPSSPIMRYVPRPSLLRQKFGEAPAEHGYNRETPTRPDPFSDTSHSPPSVDSAENHRMERERILPEMKIDIDKPQRARGPSFGRLVYSTKPLPQRPDINKRIQLQTAFSYMDQDRRTSTKPITEQRVDSGDHSHTDSGSEWCGTLKREGRADRKRRSDLIELDPFTFQQKEQERQPAKPGHRRGSATMTAAAAPSPPPIPAPPDTCRVLARTSLWITLTALHLASAWGALVGLYAGFVCDGFRGSLLGLIMLLTSVAVAVNGSLLVLSQIYSTISSITRFVVVDRRHSQLAGLAGSVATTISTSDMRRGPTKDLGTTLIMWNMPNITCIIILELLIRRNHYLTLINFYLGSSILLWNSLRFIRYVRSHDYLPRCQRRTSQFVFYFSLNALVWLNVIQVLQIVHELEEISFFPRVECI